MDINSMFSDKISLPDPSDFIHIGKHSQETLRHIKITIIVKWSISNIENIYTVHST